MATAFDRLSDLPSNVIDRILELMPLEDAVKTSALARNWRYNWTKISSLKLGSEFFQYLERRSLPQSDMVHIITKILLLHDGPKASISLYIPFPEDAVWTDVDTWIHFLWRKGVKKLILTNIFVLCNFVYKPPSHIYACLNLAQLELSGCVFNPALASYKGLPKLNELVLYEVTFEKETLECFITKCPLLAKLTLKICRGQDKVKICSTSLQELFVELGKPDLVSIEAENLKFLNLVRASWVIENPESGVSNMIRGFGGIPKIEYICLGADTLKFLAGGGTPSRLPTPLKFLRKVTFPRLDYGEPAEILSALCLIRSAPELRKIEILHIYNSAKPVSTAVPAALEEVCVMRCLQVVKIFSVRDERIELKLIKSLLASSPSLKLMSLRFDDSVDEKGYFLISKKLSKSRRASANVEIKYSLAYSTV